MSSKPGFQQWTVTEPYVNLHCGLGEGPYYEKQSNSVRFVDIMNKRLHSVNLDQGPESVTTLQLDTPISVTADIEGVDPRDKILIGAKYGAAVLDRKSGKYEYITRFNPTVDQESLRGNDGAVDPHGRFWLGTMTDFDKGPFQPNGSLHLFAGKSAAQVKKPSVTIPNSVSWSPDGKTMYFTHSSTSLVHAYDYSGEDHAISNERDFYHHQGPGGPDGHRIDVDGYMWHAVYGESRVLKISPAGELVGEIVLPTQNITCVEFVGTELFITTAKMEEGPPDEVELSGALFRVDVGVEGLKPFEFKIGS